MLFPKELLTGFTFSAGITVHMGSTKHRHREDSAESRFAIPTRARQKIRGFIAASDDNSFHYCDSRILAYHSIESYRPVFLGEFHR
jgi:hypothetical protein